MYFKVMAVAALLGGMLVIDAQDTQDATSTRQERDDDAKAENSLVGVEIFDTGLSLLDKFGSPVSIDGLTIGGGGVGPGGGFGGGGGAGVGAAGGPGGRPGPAGVGSRSNRLGVVGVLGSPFSARDPLNMFGQSGPAMADEGALPGQGSDANRVGTGSGGGVGGGSEATERVLYTRWIYHQPTSRYGFVIDKNQRVIQIEAVGLSDSKVKTLRGIKFGSTFEDIVRAYNVPDAYEISGTTLVMRYLVRDHVAFRLSKLDAKKPHQVTGIVVAAGKQ